MPRARSRRSSSARCESSCNSASIWSARPGSRSSIACASRIFTLSATSCCCAPSWMLRSSRLRSWSCAVTSRRCAACSSSSRCRSASVRPTLRSTRPACAARSRDQLLLRGVHRVVRRHRDRQARRAPRLGARRARSRSSVAIGRIRRPGRRDAPIVRRRRATRARARRRAPSASTRAIRTQHIVGGVGARELIPELGQHLVRRGSLAVHHAVGRASCPAPNRRKAQRDAERGEGRRDRTQRPHVEHDADDGDDREVSQRDEPGHQADQHGLADDEIDVEQPVPQHGERDRDREQPEQDDREVLQELYPRRRAFGGQQRHDQDERVERARRSSRPSTSHLIWARSAPRERRSRMIRLAADATIATGNQTNATDRNCAPSIAEHVAHARPPVDLAGREQDARAR